MLLYNKVMYKIPVKKLRTLKVIALVITFVCVISMFISGIFVVYSRTYVNGMSMLPTYNNEYNQTGKRDIIYINKFANIKRQDVIVLDERQNPNFKGYIVKRLVAIEGDVVNMEFDATNMQYNLIVNGKIIDFRAYKIGGYQTYDNFTSYLNNVDASKKTEQGLIIGKGEVFVLGDNWDNSKDSSLVGALKSKDVVGRVDFSISPSQNELLCVLKGIF